MVLHASAVKTLSKHYGVRVTHLRNGISIVDVSEAAKTGHVQDAGDVPADAVHVLMIRFNGAKILFSDELEHSDPPCPELSRERSARIIQSAFRRFLAAGDPTLAMPPIERQLLPCL